jgi:hypothetical protein
MPRKKQPDEGVPIKLTQAQRKAVAEFAPALAKRLKLDEPGQKTIPLTLAELTGIKEKARRAVRQADTERKRKSLRHVFDTSAQALDRSLGNAALQDEGSREWFLAELTAIASRYHWQYVAANRQQQVDQIAYRLWQEAGCPHGQHEDHWRQAERAFLADQPIRGAIVADARQNQVGQLLSPLQAVVHAQTGTVEPMDKLAEAGFLVTPGEARAIEAAADASEGYPTALRTSIERAVGLVR